MNNINSISSKPASQGGYSAKLVVDVALVVGVFDIFHAGHVRLLQRARALAERLVVVVNGDSLTSSYKRSPVMNENDRALIVGSCRYVDCVEISNNYSIRDIVVRHKVTQIIHGDDWELESYKSQIRCDDAFLYENNARLVLLPYTAGISTSEMIRKCAAKVAGKKPVTHGG